MIKFDLIANILPLNIVRTLRPNSLFHSKYYTKSEGNATNLNYKGDEKFITFFMY